jgi:hypothetical protein
MPEVNFEVNRECRTNQKGGPGKTTFLVGWQGPASQHGSTRRRSGAQLRNNFSVLSNG